MDITDVRIKLIAEPNDRLKAVGSITLDGVFVVRDLKVVDGTQGLFVAMPSRKLTVHCQRCNSKNHLRSRFCNECGSKLPPARMPAEGNGRTKLHRDIAHPITTEFRELIQAKVIEAFHTELELSKQPGYSPKDIDESEDVAEPIAPAPVEDEPSEYDALIASLRGRDAAPADESNASGPPREGGYREGNRREGGHRDGARREGGAPREGNRRDGARGGREGGRGRDSGRGGRGRDGGRGGSRPPAEAGSGSRGHGGGNRGYGDGNRGGHSEGGNRGSANAERESSGASREAASAQGESFGEMPPRPPSTRPGPIRSETQPPRSTERRERPAPPPPPPARPAPPPPPAVEENDEPFGAGIL